MTIKLIQSQIFTFLTATIWLLLWNTKYKITHLILNNIRQIKEVLGEIKFLHLRKTTTLAQIQYKAR